MYLSGKTHWTGFVVLAGSWALLFAPASAVSVHASEALRPSLKDMSQQIAKLLKGRNEDGIAVGAFTGPARLTASAGPGIKRIFIEELEKQSVRVSKKSRLEIKGDYLDVIDRNSNLLALRLKATVTDDQGEVVVVLDKKMEDRDVLAQVLGVTKPDFGAGRTPEKESEEMKKRLDKPAVDIKDTRCRAERASTYAIQIEVKRGGSYAPRAPMSEEGMAFVPLKKDEVYGVRLFNDSDFDAAIELTIDGLSMFAFSETSGYRHVVVPKRSSTLIKGWHRNNEVSNEFKITEYAKSAAAEKFINPDSTGTITVMFAAAWDPKDKPPVDEDAKFRDPFATGRGDVVKSPFKEVVRKIGRVRDVISVRYRKPSP